MFGKKKEKVDESILDDMELDDGNNTENSSLNENDYSNTENITESSNKVEDVHDEIADVHQEESDDDLEEDDTKENSKNSSKERDLILYIITDKANPSMLEYYRECGVNVSRIFTNINDAKDTLLMQINPVKIVIVDTGTGRFSAMGARKELLDLMGICDEDAKISVYYTDTVIKSEVEYNDTLERISIHWHKFRSNIDVVAHLLKNKGKENYIYDSDDKDKVKDTPSDLLDFRGLRADVPDSMNIGTPAINLNDIKVHMVENTDTSNDLVSYEIKV